MRSAAVRLSPVMSENVAQHCAIPPLAAPIALSTPAARKSCAGVWRAGAHLLPDWRARRPLNILYYALDIQGTIRT
jgi:hypothetical protein